MTVARCGPGLAGGSLVERLVEAGGERVLAACHLPGERRQVGVLRAAYLRVQRLEGVGAAVGGRERVAARLEARVAEREVHEQLRGVRAGRPGRDPDTPGNQRGEILRVLPAHQLAISGHGL